MILKVYISKRGQKPTNGDVIKALYPDATVYSYADNFKLFSDLVICPQNYMMEADRDWWNAPYKNER